MKTYSPSLEDVLQELMEEVRTPTASTSRIWCDRYPQYWEEISEIVSEWLVQGALSEGTAQFNEVLVAERSASHLSESLKAHKNFSFPGILVAAERMGMDGETLAHRLESNDLLLEILDRRSIALESIPPAFLSALARELRVSVRSIARWMAGGTPTTALGAAAVEEEAESKPFSQAWRECGLSEEALRRWSAN